MREARGFNKLKEEERVMGFALLKGFFWVSCCRSSKVLWYEFVVNLFWRLFMCVDGSQKTG